MQGPVLLYLQLGQSARAMSRDLPVIALGRARGWPMVAHVHGGGFRAAYDACPPGLQRAVRWGLEQLDRVVVLSPALRPLFAGLVAPQRIRCIPNGVEEELQMRARAKGASVRSTDALKVLYLSNLIASKGYGVVLEAARRSARRGYPHRFVLAGSPSGEMDIDPAAFVAEPGLTNVEPPGPVSGRAKYELFEAADAFVLPTRYPVEGQPISILEAFHFGLPVITTRAGGIQDVVRDGDNGLLIEPEDPDALVRSVEHLAANPAVRQAMADNNRAQAGAHYTTAAHGEAMIGLLAEVAESSFAVARAG